MDDHGDISDIDFVGQIDGVSVEDDVMKVTISMDSTFLDPEQMLDLVYACGRMDVNVVISKHHTRI